MTRDSVLIRMHVAFMHLTQQGVKSIIIIFHRLLYIGHFLGHSLNLIFRFVRFDPIWDLGSVRGT